MPGTRGLKAGKAVIELVLGTRHFDRGLRGVMRSASNIQRAFQRMSYFGRGGGRGGGLLGLLTGATSFIGAAKLLEFPIRMAAAFQKSTAEMSVYTDQARLVNEQILEMSRTSIVSVNAMQKATNTLLGYGVAGENVVDTLRALTIIARGSEDRLNRLALALGQTTAKGLLYAQETRQFVETGLNPLALIADVTGIDMTTALKFQEQGRISAEMVRAVLINATKVGGRFHGLLEEIAKTASGRFAMAMADFNVAMTELGQELLPTVVKLLTKLNGLMQTLRVYLKDNSEAAFMFARSLLIITGVSAAIVGVFTSIMALGSLMTAIVLPLNLIALVISGLMGAVITLMTMGGVLGSIIAVGSLVAAFFAVRAVVAEVSRQFAAWSEGARRVGQSLKDIILPAIQDISSAVQSGNLALAFEIAVNAMQLAWNQAWQDMSVTAGKVINDILSNITSIRMGIARKHGMPEEAERIGKAERERMMGWVEGIRQRRMEISRLKKEREGLREDLETEASMAEWRRLRDEGRRELEESMLEDVPPFLPAEAAAQKKGRGRGSAIEGFKAGAKYLQRMIGPQEMIDLEQQQLDELEEQNDHLKDIRDLLENQPGIPAV